MVILSSRLYLTLLWIPFLLQCDAIRFRHQYSHWNKRHVRREMSSSHGANQLPKFSFESQNNTEIVAQIGGSATLKCYSHSEGEEIVTWLKRDDDQLLTAGPFVYSSERRYSVSHVKNHKLWELSIRLITPQDAGTYECQLTAHPPVSFLFHLKVVEAKAVIKGQKELHVHEGSRLKLRCHILNATQTPAYVFWFHNNTMVNYVIDRPLKVFKQRYSSTLVISNVSRTDAGSYRCEPSLARADNITLHVLAGENSAAMQRGREEESRQETREENTSFVSHNPSSSSAMSNNGNSVLFALFAYISMTSQTNFFCTDSTFNKELFLHSIPVHYISSLFFSACMRYTMFYNYFMPICFKPFIESS